VRDRFGPPAFAGDAEIARYPLCRGDALSIAGVLVEMGRSNAPLAGLAIRQLPQIGVQLPCYLPKDQLAIRQRHAADQMNLLAFLRH
jgi:hypothetical protein